MYKKKGFTLIELILVLAILSILAWMGSRYLSTLDAERAYSESCTNAIYSDLADWVYYASTSRVLANDDTPDYYILEMDGTGYNFKYGTGDVTGEGVLYLSRHIEDFYYCRQSRNYHNVLVPDFKEIRMLPGLIPDGDKSGFKILAPSNPSYINSRPSGKDCNFSEGTFKLCPTGAINIKFCPKSDDESACVEYGQVAFDARTGMVKKKLCKKYKKNEPSKCEERTTGR